MTYEPTELDSRAKRDWQPAFDELKTPKQIAIIGHARPDGDAMGSTLALANHLSQMGHNCSVLYPDPWPDYNAWMPDISSSIVYSEGRERADQTIAAADWIFCLDFGSLSRIEDMQQIVEAQRGRAKLANLDHHADNDPFADFEFCEVEASSTCELVYRLLSVWGNADQIDATTAKLLYTGLLTDTGNFRHGPVTQRVHQIGGALVAAGADPLELHQLLYNTYEPKRLQFFGRALSERLKVLPELNTAYFAIPKSDMDEYGMQKSDTEGLVNYTLSIKGMRLGVLMVEYPEQIKMSFRSIGDVPANAMAKHFDGGGHFNAAGARSARSLSETETELLNLLQDYTDVLR